MTTTTTCACGETQPHNPTRYIAPGADGIDSTTRTCPGIASEAQGSLAGMTTQQPMSAVEPDYTPLFEQRVSNPLGMHMEKGRVVKGNEYDVIAAATDGRPDGVSLDGEPMTAGTARKLAGALLDAAWENDGIEHESLTVSSVERAAVAVGVEVPALLLALRNAIGANR